jgi:hypothetical protein
VQAASGQAQLSQAGLAQWAQRLVVRSKEPSSDTAQGRAATATPGTRETRVNSVLTNTHGQQRAACEARC